MKLPAFAQLNRKGSNFSAQIIIWAVLLIPILLFFIFLGLGRYKINPVDIVKILVSIINPKAGENIPEIAHMLILQVRIPRLLAAMLIGASLSVTGTAFQAIFKNPLVDSNILGVTSGAGFGAALSILLGSSPFIVQTFAFIFGLLAVFISLLGSRLYKATPLLVLTLIGILIGSLFNSLTSLLKYVADPLGTLPAITFWLLGSLTNINWQNLPIFIGITIVGLIFFWLIRWRLNILSLGDDEAHSLGMDPVRMKTLIIFFAALMTASAVSISGVIGWVGLVIPHASRMIVGSDHKRLIPVSIGLGASFLILIDTIARVGLPGEIPLGVLTGLVGAPLLIFLLKQKWSSW